jgi:anti-sigma factor RsiW
MRGSEERVNSRTQHLLRYLDREMSVEEAKAFEKSLEHSPQLRQELAEMRRIGAFVRGWAASVEERGAKLVEPTLARVRDAERKRSREATLGYVLAAALLLVLPWSRHTPELSLPHQHRVVLTPPGAAIERLEAADTRAQVFVVGGSSTPVVWLADDAPDQDSSELQGPG